MSKHITQLWSSCVCGWLSLFKEQVRLPNGSDRYGPGATQQHRWVTTTPPGPESQMISVTSKLSPRGVRSLNTDPAFGNKWQTRRTWIIKENYWKNLLTLPWGLKNINKTHISYFQWFSQSSKHTLAQILGKHLWRFSMLFVKYAGSHSRQRQWSSSAKCNIRGRGRRLNHMKMSL